MASSTDILPCFTSINASNLFCSKSADSLQNAWQLLLPVIMAEWEGASTENEIQLVIDDQKNTAI